MALKYTVNLFIWIYFSRTKYPRFTSQKFLVFDIAAACVKLKQQVFLLINKNIIFLHCRVFWIREISVCCRSSCKLI